MKKYMEWGVVAILACSHLNVVGQDWNSAGNFGLPASSFLGNTDGVPVNFRTNNILRMRLLPTLTGQTIGTYTNENLSGNVGIGAFGSGTVGRPFSLLHLDNGGTQFSGYRPWHRPGMTITSGSDLGWIGLKNEGGDLNHFTLAWADNTATQGPDLFKMIFLANPSTTGTAGTLNGLEAMRIRPLASGLESFFGIGDWFTAGVSPDERLDILDRTIRIRRLIPDYQNNELENVVVADANGRLFWRPLSGFASGCDWQVQSPYPHVSTVYAASSCSWGLANGVGIGVAVPKEKLSVVHTDNSLLHPIAIRGTSLFNLQVDEVYGVLGEARPVALGTPQGMTAIGVGGVANDSRTTIGVQGVASIGVTGSTSTLNAVGVAGTATASGNALRTIGVYGSATGADPSGTNWGGYFEGKGFLGTGPWVYSDENLKQGIEDLSLTGSIGTLMQLHPKSYTFNAEEFPYLHLPEGEQLGLISQEVEEVFPQLVMDVIRPAKEDSTGQVIEPELTFKAMNYDGLIPVLIAGFQQQQAMIDQQQATIAEMQAQLAACCAAQDQGMAAQPEGGVKNTAVEELREQRLLIIPNPVADLTELRYYVPQAGKVSLQVGTSDGKPLGSLREEQAESGEYSYTWNTTKLAAGTYFCTLMVDGTVVVKRAVKVQ